MHIAVRYKDGSKNLLAYEPSELYTTEQISAGTKEHVETTTGKKVSVILVQVSDRQPVAELQTA